MLFYWFIKGLAWPLVRVYLKFSRRGTEGIARRGPCIIVANHTSYLDAAVLGSAVPRPVNFLISHDIYMVIPFRWFYLLMGAIPLKTEGGDSAAMRRALRTLRQGHAIGIFPEGERTVDGRIGEAKQGVAFLAWRSGAPVIPAAILGAHEAMPVGTYIPRPRPVQVRFGEPILYPESGDRPEKEDLLSFTEGVMDAIAAMGAPKGEEITAGSAGALEEERS